ncbi:MAG: phenylalanine--tRNA ligase subunit beta, partial [Eubacteriaceae bacterium]|nr:phenylalanine--tRNA ligase subunit beta [Eubacteriaceae bacterium]
MLVSLDWLKEYTKVDRSVDEYVDRMNITGSKVEFVDYKDENLKDIIVAKIIKKEKHPNADKLSVCTVDIGLGKTETIITAATNIKQGDTIPLALVGAQLLEKKIGVTEFRGITSNGMMCSGEELGLDASVLPKNSEGGIYVFSEELKCGEDALTHLGLHDVVIDFEITNNRPDCQSMIGMAREFAAAFYNPVKVPDAKIKETKSDIGKYLSIEIADPDLCHRYVGRMMKVKKIEQSPLWMQRRLMACGFRPINNIVDVTNYILLEVGQPLHAFDYKMIEGNKIIVRRAKKDEKITTLDGKERACCEDLLLITDTKKGVGIAGIMGGQNSEITNDTQMIVIESAAFNAENIRKSSVKMNMNTDAAALFSKGVNASMSTYAADRAAQLLIQIGACELIEGIIDIYPSPAKPVKIAVDSVWVNKFLGM